MPPISNFSLTYTILCICIIFCISDGYGQKTFQPKQIEFDWKGIVYRNETAFDFTLHTNGFAIAYNRGRILTYDKTRFYHLSLGYIRDPRERRQNKNQGFNGKSSKTFAFGKINSLYVIRAGIGRKKYLSEKAKRKGIAIGYTYEMGPSIAVLKPNYLELIYTTDVDGQPSSELREEKYSEENADVFLDYNRVFGGSSFSKGWDEVSFTPGIQAKGGLLFSLGAYDKYVKTIEVGAMVDLYIKKIAILAETEAISNKPYFVNLYVTLQFGSRSN